MREYVDAIQGPGAWDRMHDLIEQKQIAGWSLPPITVDGHNVNIFPGEDREVTLDAVQNEIRKVFAQLDRGDYEEVNPADLD
jgi:hypothetical protein